MKWKNLVCLTLGCLLIVGCGSDVENDAGEEGRNSVWVEHINRGLEEDPDGSVPMDTAPILEAFAEEPPTAKNLHTLIQDRYPETVSMPDLMRQIAATSEGRVFIGKMLSELAPLTGIEVKKEDMDQILEHPETILDMLQFPLNKMAVARDILSRLFQGMRGLERPDVPLPGILKNEYRLPQFFDYDSADESPYEVPPSELITLMDGIYVGVVHDSMFQDEELRRNFIFAEVVERLGLNITATEEDLFTVAYNGQTYTRLSSFLQALLEDGHEMRAVLRHYVAPFFPVYAKGPDGELHPVAATTFLRTGIKDSEGIEAALPMFHSEFVFYVSSTEMTRGRGINASTQFYQGIPKTGFYGEGNMELPLWLGETISDSDFSSEEAAVAMLLAGYLVDVTRAVAEEQQLAFDGWGVNGVCNDSAAVVQKAVHGKINSYPLFMPDTLMEEQLTSRIEEGFDSSDSYLDFLVYRLLRKSILDTPEDLSPTPASRLRLLQSFPWEPGDEPFYSTVEARRIILGQPTTSPEDVDSDR